MKICFVSRHEGAVELIRRHDVPVTHFVPHLSADEVEQGDVVIGNLPIHLVMAVMAKGARYLHLTIEIPNERRGCELSAEEMQGYALRFNEVKVTSGKDISLAGLKDFLRTPN